MNMYIYIYVHIIQVHMHIHKLCVIYVVYVYIYINIYIYVLKETFDLFNRRSLGFLSSKRSITYYGKKVVRNTLVYQPISPPSTSYKQHFIYHLISKILMFFSSHFTYTTIYHLNLFNTPMYIRLYQHFSWLYARRICSGRAIRSQAREFCSSS